MNKIKGNSKYFLAKYSTSNPVFIPEKKLDFRTPWGPASFLFLGRALAEGVPVDRNTIYGHINGEGEFVHQSELEVE